MTRDSDGMPLVPGVNVDPIDVEAGKRQGAMLGYGDWRAQIVIENALLRHKRGEEESAMKLWLSEYPRDLGSWYAILALAVTSASKFVNPYSEPVPDGVGGLSIGDEAAIELNDLLSPIWARYGLGDKKHDEALNDLVHTVRALIEIAIEDAAKDAG